MIYLFGKRTQRWVSWVKVPCPINPSASTSDFNETQSEMPLKTPPSCPDDLTARRSRTEEAERLRRAKRRAPAQRTLLRMGDASAGRLVSGDNAEV
ncbi:hypothetical protein EYF80_036259 [Liparis tanakae]|uniref:Uncharacterized protein n=1 Tax=Liparis tanakae TaxID=230148 RepID=A0A4Z2GJU3_9TELE|nr:hypothetical protein EYF80_036259 [Liparis tanakae]